MISSYDRMDDVLFFCGIIKDFERIVSYHVQNKDVPAALSVLSLKEVCVVFDSSPSTPGISRGWFPDPRRQRSGDVLQVHAGSGAT